MSVDVVISGNNINVETSQRVLSTIPSTWDEFVSNYGRGYNYPPPTGQTTVYRTGDDADIEATIFGATVRQAETLKARNTLASFLVLNNNNSFGNTNRFTDDLGTQVMASDYMIDHYTGLGWHILADVQIPWNTGIDNALALTLNGFSDYFIPNLNQIKSIYHGFDSSSSPWNYAPLNLLSNFVAVNSIGSSNTSSTTTNSLYFAGSFNVGMRAIAKTTNFDYLTVCRKHF